MGHQENSRLKIVRCMAFSTTLQIKLDRLSSAPSMIPFIFSCVRLTIKCYNFGNNFHNCINSEQDPIFSAILAPVVGTALHWLTHDYEMHMYRGHVATNKLNTPHQPGSLQTMRGCFYSRQMKMIPLQTWASGFRIRNAEILKFDDCLRTGSC